MTVNLTENTLPKPSEAKSPSTAEVEMTAHLIRVNVRYEVHKGISSPVERVFKGCTSASVREIFWSCLNFPGYNL